MRGSALERGLAAPAERIGSFAERYDLVLPPEWQRWCGRHGWLRQADADWELLGLTPAPSGLDAAALLAGMRFTFPGFPPDLVPIEQLPERQLACLEINGSDDPPVVIVDLDDGQTWTERQPAAARFSQYAEDFTEQARALRRVGGFLDREKRAIDSGRRAADQAPRPDDWRAYRFCSQNVVVAVVVLRHNRDDGVLDIGACLVAALSRLDPDAPARALCTLLLAEAYRAGGDLSMRFLKGSRPGAENVAIPWPIVQWAGRAGVELERNSGQISADEALRLFIESVHVSDRLRSRLRGESSRPDTAAICYGVASGLWHPAEAEVLLAWSDHPGRLLRGSTESLDRASFSGDLLDIRSALLVAAVVRRVAAGAEDRKLDAEDVGQPVELVAHTDGTCTLQAATIDLSDWLVSAAPWQSTGRLDLAVADAEQDQLSMAVEAALARLATRRGGLSAVVCPRDVLALGSPALGSLTLAAERAGAVLLAAPEYTPGLTIRATEKLARARMARQ